MQRPRATPVTALADRAEGSRLVWQALAGQQARLMASAARLKAARAGDVHDARVAARRLRSLLATYRPLLDLRSSRRLRRRLKDFARALTEAREAEVRQDLLLGMVLGEPVTAATDAARLRAMLRACCAKSKRALRETIAAAAWSAAVDVLGDARMLETLCIRRYARLDDVLELVDRPWRDVVELLAGRPTGAAKLHRLRLAFKRCRYALESVAGLRPEQAEQVLDRLRLTQDSLGAHRDAAQARDWVRDNAKRLGRPLARRLDRELKKRGTDLATEAVDLAFSVLPAYAAWRRATADLRRGPLAVRDRS
jgi:CHAD domain-containing protein